MEHTTIAVDLAQSVFQVAVSHRAGSVDDEQRLPRDRFLAFVAQRSLPALRLVKATDIHDAHEHFVASVEFAVRDPIGLAAR